MNISIRLIDISCREKLFQFELLNREFFEKTSTSRGDSYYDVRNFKKILDELITEQKDGLVYMYLVYNQFNEIVGRINLVNVQRGNSNKAELGYRIGEIHKGKGYATNAVKLILEEASNIYSLHKVVAGTSSKNIASQNILIKNGFEFIDKQLDFVLLNGEWHDNVIFEKLL